VLEDLSKIKPKTIAPPDRSIRAFSRNGLGSRIGPCTTPQSRRRPNAGGWLRFGVRPHPLRKRQRWRLSDLLWSHNHLAWRGRADGRVFCDHCTTRVPLRPGPPAAEGSISASSRRYARSCGTRSEFFSAPARTER